MTALTREPGTGATEIVDAPTETPVVPVRTASDVLLGAARLIEEFGWTQDEYGDEVRGMCVNGALQRVIRSHSGRFDDDESTLYGSVLHRFYQATGHNSMGFNDTPGRTRDEVLAALRAAADLPTGDRP